jgi:hypothetical protein
MHRAVPVLFGYGYGIQLVLGEGPLSHWLGCLFLMTASYLAYMTFRNWQAERQLKARRAETARLRASSDNIMLDVDDPFKGTYRGYSAVFLDSRWYIDISRSRAVERELIEARVQVRALPVDQARAQAQVAQLVQRSRDETRIQRIADLLVITSGELIERLEFLSARQWLVNRRARIDVTDQLGALVFQVLALGGGPALRVFVLDQDWTDEDPPEAALREIRDGIHAALGDLAPPPRPEPREANIWDHITEEPV